MALQFMNKLRQLVLLALASLGGSLNAQSTTTVSPDGTLSIVHQPAERLAPSDAKEPVNLWIYSLLHKGKLAWSGVSFVDESAYDSQVLWSPDSACVLILDRPQRSECEAFMLIAGVPKVRRLQTQKLIDAAFREAGEVHDHFLQKAWFADWKWKSDRVATGKLRFAKKHTYTLLIEWHADDPVNGIKVISRSMDADRR